MHIRAINKFVTTGLSALSALTLCSVLAALYFQSEQVRALEQQRESLKLANQLAAGSDLLTNAVRSFAATGEAKYEEAYLHEVNIDHSRDKAVQGLAALGTPGNELGLIEEAKRNSDDLINLENRAFDAGRADNLKLAVELVYGPSYHTAKAKIMTPIGQFRLIMNQRLAEKVAQASKKADTSMTAAVSLVIASILATILVQLMFYRRKVLFPLLQMQAEVDGLGTRNENAVLSARDDDSEIGSLARSIVAYHNIALQSKKQQQTKQQLSEIVVALQQAVDLPDLAQKLMSHISPILDVGYGLFYVADAEKRTLRMVGGYGLAPGDSDREVAFGDGLAGQCAIDQKPILITNLPAGYIHIASGSGSATPACIMLRPLIQNKKIVGVVELASFLLFDDGDKTFLAELEPTLAALIEIIGAQKQHELALDSQMAFQQTLIDSIPYPIFYKGPDSRFLGVNRAYEETFAIHRKDLIGKRVVDLEHLPEQDRIAYQAGDERIIAETGAVSREITVLFADGKLHNTLCFVSGFRNSDGTPGGLIGTFIDLSGLKSGK